MEIENSTAFELDGTEEDTKTSTGFVREQQSTTDGDETGMDGASTFTHSAFIGDDSRRHNTTSRYQTITG